MFRPNLIMFRPNLIMFRFSLVVISSSYDGLKKIIFFKKNAPNLIMFHQHPLIKGFLRYKKKFNKLFL